MSSQLTQSLVYEAQPAPDVDTVSGRHPKELGSKFTVVCTKPLGLRNSWAAIFEATLESSGLGPGRVRDPGLRY